MRGLGLRLALSLAAAALMGLSLVDVAFVAWSSRKLNEARRVDLYACTTQVLEHLDDPDWFGRLPGWAQENNVILSLRNPDGRRYSTAVVTLPVEALTHGWAATVGLEHTMATLPPRSGWQQLWVSRHTDDILPEVYALQRRALVWLAAAAAIMVSGGMLFMRRTVLSPLTHLTDLLFAGDAAGVARMGADPRAGLGGLGSAVIGMAHTVEEDRARIASQLEDLRATHAALASTQKQLVRSERLAVVGKLAAGLAHEVGNPLAVVGGFVELLRDEGLPSEQRQQAVARIEHELLRIQKTVRQLLDFSRAPNTSKQAGDVREAVSQLQLMLSPQDRWRDIRLLMPKLDGPVPVRVDTDALVQVLLNLFFNAADALGNKGTFRISLRRLQEGSIALDVEDSGPGISDEIAVNIFEPFFTTKPAGVGTGLGLAVCEGIINAAGGDISVGRSATLGGARFVLVLPPPAAV